MRSQEGSEDALYELMAEHHEQGGEEALTRMGYDGEDLDDLRQKVVEAGIELMPRKKMMVLCPTCDTVFEARGHLHFEKSSEEDPW